MLRGPRAIASDRRRLGPLARRYQCGPLFSLQKSSPPLLSRRYGTARPARIVRDDKVVEVPALSGLEIIEIPGVGDLEVLDTLSVRGISFDPPYPFLRPQ